MSTSAKDILQQIENVGTLENWNCEVVNSVQVKNVTTKKKTCRYIHLKGKFKTNRAAYYSIDFDEVTDKPKMTLRVMIEINDYAISKKPLIEKALAGIKLPNRLDMTRDKNLIKNTYHIPIEELPLLTNTIDTIIRTDFEPLMMLIIKELNRP